MSARSSAVRRNFSRAEDDKLRSLVAEYGTEDWESVASKMSTRNARQCHDRWTMYLDPQLRNDPWTEEEDSIILIKYLELGPRWKSMTAFFNGRSENSLKARWHYYLKEQQVIHKKPQVPEPVHVDVKVKAPAASIEQMDFSWIDKAAIDYNLLFSDWGN